MKKNFKEWHNLLAPVFFLLLVNIYSCKKQDSFLEIKSRKNDVVPSTLADYQAILDNTNQMNTGQSIAGLVGSDNMYFTDANLNAADAQTRNEYLWAKDLYQGAGASDWSQPYSVVEWANIVLDGLNSLPNDGSAAYNNVKGSALFYRAMSFYRLSQLYCKPYTSTASADPGIPIRLSSDITLPVTRGTVEQTYLQILSDLSNAAQLLPQTPQYKTRPSSVAVNALLAKVYLFKSDYTNAFKFADLVLKSYNKLLDFNTLKQVTTNPFPSFATGNPEIIFYAQSYGGSASVLTSAKCRADTNLIKSYANGDLRKGEFFVADGTTGLFRFKGPYTDNTYEFTGIATDEIYLIHAECLARSGDLTNSAADLNTLLKARYTAATYQAATPTSQTTLIQQIILERRKEMPFTANLRWEDLRRLNIDPAFAITLTRNSGGVKYSLAPNDNRYVLPIPDPDVQLSGIAQNPR